MSPRKLLVVTDEMEVGGSQRQITYLLGGIDRTRWQPELLYFRKESFLVKELRAQGITVHHLPKRGRLDLKFLFRYAAFLRRQRYDLIHAFSLTAELWTLLARLMIKPRPPLVASIRGLYLAESGTFWAIKRQVLKHSAAIIANARAGAQAASDRSGIPLERFDVIPNGMTPAKPLPPGQDGILRDAVGVPRNRTFGLFVGRLVKEKNLACLMRAMAALPAEHRPWIALAGNGPLRENINAMREVAGLHDDVRFLGERTDATSLMKAADFLVLPSSYEGMSNVLMEAMAAGCPVLASQVGGNPELIEHGHTGLLFPDDDAAGLARQLRRLSEDPALRDGLAQRAQQQANTRFSVATMVGATQAIYDRCMVEHALHGALPDRMMASGHTGEDA